MIAAAPRTSGLLPAEQVQEAKRADISGYLPGLKFHARTSGGEYHGPCPQRDCGGKDRLIYWPRHPKGPRVQCRRCHPESMNPVDFVQWIGQAPDFRGAVLLLTGGRLPSAAPLPPPAINEPPRPYEAPRPPYREVAYYTYVDLEGRLLYQKVRIEPGYNGKRKTFLIRHGRPDIEHPRDDHPEDWYKGAAGRPAQPYNLLAALQLADGAPLLWVDGEKDVETARAAGLVAVCSPHGGEHWQEHWSPLFCNHPAIIIPDQEPGGQDAAARAARMIAPFADSVRIVPLPAKDLTAWLETGLTLPGGASHAV